MLRRKRRTVSALVALLGFASTAGAADYVIPCKGYLKNVATDGGMLMASFGPGLGPLVCRYADSTIQLTNALDVSVEECKVWQSSLMVALAANKPVSLTFVVPQYESCDALLLQAKYHWRVRGVALNSD